ncbi:thioredoxin reductase (NADPH) [Mariniflexile fucanivorans]|uniref:Thioredoxin reductase (NADPH) n=1 Tax=Mariniflexile fucanivorans TaxID=264023 RepID=A0A4R1RB11_9FLAO|nr:FAD-dependent oxidoreductase [Mariniflexile fucanivorans]TCL62622.1 thioredoxin reductase (NADPH) [Mariniflexile fucanivorans]
MNTIQFFGADWCPDCQRAKAYLKENNINFNFVDVDLDKDATARVEAINKGKRIIPTIIINDKPFTNPDNAILANTLGINKNGRVLLYGANWCPDCQRAKAYLQDNHINFQFIEVDKHDWAAKLVEETNKGKRIIPTIFIDDVAYTNPDNAVLKDVLSIGHETEKRVYDSIIVGAGAAGLTASIYIQRDRFNSLILEKKNIGGNAFLTEKIENYPGFTTISGPELTQKMAEQAKTYGAKIETGVSVNAIKKTGTTFSVTTNMGQYESKTVVLALGSTYRKLGIPNEEDLIGAGIHFCATCDGAFYRDREIIVIGGGNSALEEGVFLAKFCKKVTIVNRGTEFTASQTYIEKLTSIKNIETYMNKESVEFIKNDKGNFKGLKVKDRTTGETQELYADGTFIFIGLIPNTDSIKDLIQLSERGFITTTGLAETNVKGIFAAGDCREGAIAQVAAATGEGVLASYGVRQYFN